MLPPVPALAEDVAELEAPTPAPPSPPLLDDAVDELVSTLEQAAKPTPRAVTAIPTLSLVTTLIWPRVSRERAPARYGAEALRHAKLRG
jgi:hypothetical protein